MASTDEDKTPRDVRSGDTTCFPAPEPLQLEPQVYDEARPAIGGSLPQIESLLKVVQAEESIATVIQTGGRQSRLNRECIRPFDFRRPAALTNGDLHKLQLRHEEFVRSLAAHLSDYLRLEIGLKLVKVETVDYSQYRGLPGPTHLALFKVEPLPGVGVIELPLGLALMLVDRLLGGPAHSVAPSGELSEIETALLDQITLLILNDWGQLWQKVETLRPTLAGHETDSQFLKGSEANGAMLVLSAEMRLGDCAEPLQLALPLAALDRLVRKTARAGELSAAASPKPAPAKWNPTLNEVPICLRAQCHGLELSARALSRLKPGDVLRLAGEDFGRVEVLFEKAPRYHARLGTAGNHWAAQLTEAVVP